MKKTTEVDIPRTSEGLREALYEGIDDLRNGKSDHKKAQALANLAKQIVSVVRMEIDYHLLVSNTEDGKKSILGDSLHLGVKKDV